MLKKPTNRRVLSLLYHRFPVLTAYTLAAVQVLIRACGRTALSLGAGASHAAFTTLWEVRFTVTAVRADRLP